MCNIPGPHYDLSVVPSEKVMLNSYTFTLSSNSQLLSKRTLLTYLPSPGTISLAKDSTEFLKEMHR